MSASRNRAAPPTGDGSADLSPIARGGVRSFIFRVLTAVTDFLVVLVTARGFGAEGRGLYALASFSVTAVIVVVGGASVIMRAEVGRQRVPLGRLYAACVALSGGALGLAGVAIVLIVLLWPGALVPLCVAIASPFSLLAQLQMSLYQAQGDVRRMHYVGLARSAVPMAALAVVALIAPGQVRVALLVWAGAQFVVPFVALHLQRRRTTFQWHGVGPLLRRLIWRGIPVSVAQSVFIVGTRIDVIVLAALLSVADVGRYSIALAAGEALLLLSRAVTTGAYARMISAPLDESIRITVRTLRHCVALVVGAGAALVVVVGVGAEPILGSGFAGVWIPLAILLPAFVATSVGELLVNFLVVRLERFREVVLQSIGMGVVNLALALPLVLALGVAGAALATSLAFVAGAIYLLARFAHFGGPREVRRYLPTRVELADYQALLTHVGAARQRLRR